MLNYIRHKMQRAGIALLMVPIVAGAQSNDAGTLVPVLSLLLFNSANSVSLSILTLNDTGITWGGDYPDGNNATCTSNITGPQDCNQGRDVTHDDSSDGHAGFSYTKLDASGNPLAASASNWSCVKDNVTGLIWEVKTSDGSIHDKDDTYRWGGKTHLGSGYGTYYTDWDSLVVGSNSASFCGYSDWRVPSKNELLNLASRDRTNPAIDTEYFPNTLPVPFWSTSPYARDSSSAWYVKFSYGNSDQTTSPHLLFVRLVRGGQLVHDGQ